MEQGSDVAVDVDGVPRTQGPATALVVVPFTDMGEATEWADKIAASYPEQPRVVVTAGRNDVVMTTWTKSNNDPATSTVLTFSDGWRALEAHRDSVTIARTSDGSNHA